jgi:hypothetical protein
MYGHFGRKELIMKKLSLMLVSLLMFVCLFGCATNEAAAPENAQTIEVTEPVETDSPLARPISDKEISTELSRGTFTPYLLSKKEVDFSDFDFLEEWMYSGFPEDAYYPYASYMPGEWKYRIFYLRDNSVDGFMFNEIGLSDIDIDFDSATFYLDLHPRYDNYNNEIVEVSDEDVGYSTFSGGFEGDGIKLVDQEGELIIYIYSYFAYEGREYIYSTLYMSEEDYAMLVFTRGQN